ELVVTTNLGEIRGIIDVGSAYCGAASVSFLADLGFYDDTRCERLDTRYGVLTCGGDKAPSYQFPVEGLPRTPVGTASPAPEDPTADPSSYYARGAIVLDNVDVNAV